MITPEQKNKALSGAITAVIMAVVVVICVSFGYNPPNPPIAEEGVEVNLGNSDSGLGTAPNPAASAAASQYVPPSASERISTQSTEATTPVNSSAATGNATNPTATTQTKPENKQPEINSRALFTGKRNNSADGGNEGVAGGEGNQGKAGGDPNSKRYDGQPGQGGSGFSLQGRSAVHLPKPAYNSNRQGKIVVKIWVDRDGNVTKAEAPEKGSSILDKTMVEQARTTALKAKFNPKSDAPETQTGTITYTYIVN